MKSRYLFPLGAALCSLFAAANPVLAQSTAFTYNGVLNHNGAPVNGTYDLRVTLYDAAVAGNVVAGPMPVNAVGVTNGLFAARVDFGLGVFTGAPRWLSVEVQPTGGGGFVPLNPRQEVTSSPYAIRATTAGTATSVANGAVVKSLNNLHDDLTLAAGANVTITPSGNTLTLAAAGAGGSGIWSVLNNNAYYLAGGVGIGTNNPEPGYSLEVKGPTRLTTGGSGGVIRFGTPNAETGMTIIGANRADIRFDGSTLKLLAGPGTTSPGKGITIDTQGNVGLLNFGAVLGQHLSLWSDPAFTRYFGIGVQNSTLYSRCGGGGADGFAWYKGGTHNDQFHNGGGGQLLMTLDSNGLYLSGPASVCSLLIRGGCDLAEPFPMKEQRLEEGSVVVIDNEHPGQLKLSTEAYDTRVAGIVSGANGVNAGIALHQEGTLEGGQNVALSGRVYVQADAAFGAINPGDMLTTSDTPGHAMKAADHTRRQGAILGKAMSSLREGKGLVLVLVTLQ